MQLQCFEFLLWSFGHFVSYILVRNQELGERRCSDCLSMLYQNPRDPFCTQAPPFSGDGVIRLVTGVAERIYVVNYSTDYVRQSEHHWLFFNKPAFLGEKQRHISTVLGKWINCWEAKCKSEMNIDLAVR